MMMRKSLVLLVALVVVLGWGSGASAVPIEWNVASGGNGHFYEVVIDPLISWDDARVNALANGANWDLASVTSQEEQDFITALLPSSPSNREHLWLGGRDINTEGVWEWSNGDTFGYVNWWDGEPSGGIENYMAMDFRLEGTYASFTGWMWNDSLGSQSLITGYVSEQSIDPIPEPNTALLLGFGLLGLGVKRRSRRAVLH